jgi:hypothetical protein|tara:strand:- start:781 stop:1845 length:1065 start_codon:yes stop_codon:yes gene_type:complete
MIRAITYIFKVLFFVYILSLILVSTSAFGQGIKKAVKFSTFYVAANGGTSLSDRDVFSVADQLSKDIIETPYDYSLTAGIRKIKRFQYEATSPFKDGTETTYSDAATIGLSPFEYLFEIDYRRQEGIEYIDQTHFIRYVENSWLAKAEYVLDGFADVEYFEVTQRFRVRGKKKLSFNIGAIQRLSEPYGYDPLADWILSNGNLHYTQLAIEEGYSIDVYDNQYMNPDGDIVATSSDVWKEIVIPQVLSDYAERKRNELDNQWVNSIVLGFDYYTYTKNFWLHSWGNFIPYHYDDGSQYSYHNFNNGEQWYDYSGGLIFGLKITKHLGTFVEGKYHKYWNREWYDFKLGVNYIIF